MVCITYFLKGQSFLTFIWVVILAPTSATRLGDFLDFGQLFKAFGNN